MSILALARYARCVFLGACGVAHLGCAAGALIEPAPGDVVYELVSVDDRSLPHVDSLVGFSGFGDITGVLRTTVYAAELALRPDSSGMLVRRVRRQDDATDVTRVDTIIGSYRIDAGALSWCPVTGSFTVCTGSPVQGGEFVVRTLTGSAPAHDYRFRER